jgi:glucokinase
MDRRFVVVSGLPGSGKSRLARALAPVLNLPVIDKDDILDRLFDAKGVGDAAWRRSLSGESDVLFRDEAQHSNGAILVSFWRLPGMPTDSGTPADWLPALSSRIVNLHCQCPTAIAAARYCQRWRHPGHLDGLMSPDEVLAQIQRVAGVKPLEIGARVECDTSFEVDVPFLARSISKALGEPAGR